MIIDGIARSTNLGNGRMTVRIYLPKYSHGIHIMSISNKYDGRPIKFFTSVMDLGVFKEVKVNGSRINIDKLDDTKLSRGMIIEKDNDNSVYIVMPERLLK